MKNEKKSLGNWGENQAAAYLIRNGFTILEKNLRFPFGEVDIIAEKEKILYFCEIKTRSSDYFGEGWEAVGKRKIEKIKKVAETYIQIQNLNKEVRVAVISILHTRKKDEIKFLLV